MKDILKGKLVQLAAVDPEEVSKSFAAWNRDSARSWSSARKKAFTSACGR